MNKDSAKDYLPLVQALADGKVIQFCGKFRDGWVDLHESAEFFIYGPDFYRIKPEPSEIWVNEYEGCISMQCWPSEKVAKANAIGKPVRQVRYREVIE